MGTAGFPAVPGWDAQTGLGQPKFAGLLKYLGSSGPTPATACTRAHRQRFGALPHALGCRAAFARAFRADAHE